MKFCPKCGNLMVAKKKRKYSFLVCRKCGREMMLKDEKIKISESIHEAKKQVAVLKKDEELEEFPVTKIMCPQCEHMEAHWWMQQTRGADEPPTMFYKCRKCGYTWRSYG